MAPGCGRRDRGTVGAAAGAPRRRRRRRRGPRPEGAAASPESAGGQAKAPLRHREPKGRPDAAGLAATDSPRAKAVVNAATAPEIAAPNRERRDGGQRSTPGGERFPRRRCRPRPPPARRAGRSAADERAGAQDRAQALFDGRRRRSRALRMSRSGGRRPSVSTGRSSNARLPTRSAASRSRPAMSCSARVPTAEFPTLGAAPRRRQQDDRPPGKADPVQIRDRGAEGQFAVISYARGRNIPRTGCRC